MSQVLNLEQYEATISLAKQIGLQSFNPYCFSIKAESPSLKNCKIFLSQLRRIGRADIRLANSRICSSRAEDRKIVNNSTFSQVNCSSPIKNSREKETVRMAYTSRTQRKSKVNFSNNSPQVTKRAFGTADRDTIVQRERKKILGFLLQNELCERANNSKVDSKKAKKRTRIKFNSSINSFEFI